VAEEVFLARAIERLLAERVKERRRAKIIFDSGNAIG
jgi:hypothetical protein